MKKVLITGGAGFIGANFVYTFLDLGYQVFVIERKEANLWRIDAIKNKINIYHVDLTDYKALEDFILKLQPNIILHFATYGAYQAKQQDIKTTIDTNLLGTINLVNACSKIKFDCLINTGSSSEYGVKNKPMKETDVLEPDNLYGITKSAANQYCQMMAKKFNFPVVTIRPFAVYGYFEEKERLVPSIITSCLKNTTLKLSSPDSVRDFIFIEDVMDAYVSAIKNIEKIKGEIFNVGRGEQYTISDVVTLVQKITGSKLKPQYHQTKAAQTEPKTWVADISKAKKLLHWKPNHTFEQGLKKDIDWFKNHLSLYE